MEGGDGNDTFFGGSGNDTMVGDSGDDTYYIEVNGGIDTIIDTADNGQVNTLVFSNATLRDLRISAYPNLPVM
jgi:Ca2+-binding RTX toxin-like protein